MSDAQMVTCDLGNKTIYASVTGIINNANYYYKLKYDTGYGVLESDVKKFKIREYADLGLSMLWATCNVGADSPEDFGKYFSWGEITEGNYMWNYYKWCNGPEHTLTKYNTDLNYGIVDNKTILELEDDVAHINWGGAWRMPTYDEFNGLKNNCTWTFTWSPKGYQVKGINGGSIFLPTAGYCCEANVNSTYSDGFYWPSTLYSDTPSNAYYLRFQSDGVGVGNIDRYYGLSVRPVCLSQN